MQCAYNMNAVTSVQYNAHSQCKQMSPVSALNKLVIFDWDDTIFPTTALLRLKESVSGAELERFGKSAYELMAKYINAFSAENIYIVTNGKTGWVEKSLDAMSRTQRALSGLDYWAQIRQLLASHMNGRIISARSLFEQSFPEQTAVWKTLVFQHIAAQHFAGCSAQSGCAIISIGDSSDEYTASLKAQEMLSAQFGAESVKLVRFKLERSPSRDVMLKQFDFLCQCSTEMAIAIDHSCNILVADLL